MRRRTAASLAATLVVGSMLGTREEVHAAPRPDLVVTAQSLSMRGGGNVIIRPSRRGFTWSHRTKNVGNAAAGSSQTAVQFVAGSGGPITPGGARLPVPRLRAGRSHAGNDSFSVDVVRWEFGTYRTRICADWRDDIHERDESNNCERLQPIYVIPFDLTGRVSGRMPLHTDGNVTVRWATDITFDLATSTIGTDGVFDYRFFEGPVRYTVEGTDALGCTWTGSGTYQPSSGPDTIRLQFGPRHRYDAQNFLPNDFHFTVTRTCSGLPADIDFYPGSQLLTKWFDTNGWREFPDPGLTHLRGRFVDNVTTNRPITYSWNLEAGP